VILAVAAEAEAAYYPINGYEGDSSCHNWSGICTYKVNRLKGNANMDITKTRPHTADFVKAEIRTGLFFSMVGADRTFQNPLYCESPTVKAQQIYQAMRGCLPRLKNVSADDERWIKVHLEELRQYVQHMELPPAAPKL
jgi:hypothetical protein